MPRFTFLLIAAFVFSQAMLAMAQDGSAIQWQGDLDAARAVAERENKLLLVHFYTNSCGPCRLLDATVFNQPNVAAAVHQNFVPVKLNANDFQATAERFGITRVPTDVVISPQGQVIERMVSPATPMAYIGRLSGVATQYSQQVGRNFQTVVANQPTSKPVNSAYAGLSVPANGNSFAAPATPSTTPEGVTSNPYASNLGTAAPAYSATATPTPPASQPSPAPVAVANPYAQQPSASSAPPAERYATAATAPPEVAGAAQPSIGAAQQLPPNSPPLGFFGYCPVTMKKENKWQRGDARWGCYHRGRTYLFTSAEKRDEFLENGDEFAPALSGIDPVVAIDSGKIEPGKQEFGIEYDGRFYLFSSEDNLRKFWSQAPHYASGVRQAMNSATTPPKYR